MVATSTQSKQHDTASSWRSYPISALLVRWVVLLVPSILTFISVFFLSRAFPPGSFVDNRLTWVATFLALGVFLLLLFERLSRRLLPLVALYQLALTFPEEAPSRFSLALRANSTRSLERRIRQFKVEGISNDESTHGQTILELVAALSIHDRMTRGHCERVRAYTDMIAEQIELPEDDRMKLRWASLLHDAGKIHVPQNILSSKGKLSDKEWELIKAHTSLGDELTRPLHGWMGQWSQAVRNHHERWDGGGYPDGLSGNYIPLGARIVAVADAYDVMTSTRSYKKPIPPAEALAEIARCSGTQFDPAVVRAFLNIGIGKLRMHLGPFGWLASFFSLSTNGVAMPLQALKTVFMAGLATTSSVAIPLASPLNTSTEQETVQLAFSETTSTSSTAASLLSTTIAALSSTTTTQLSSQTTIASSNSVPSSNASQTTTKRPTAASSTTNITAASLQTLQGSTTQPVTAAPETTSKPTTAVNPTTTKKIATTKKATSTSSTATTTATTSTTQNQTTTTHPNQLRIVLAPEVIGVGPTWLDFKYTTNNVCGSGSFVYYKKSTGAYVGEHVGDPGCFGPYHEGRTHWGNITLEPNTVYEVRLTVDARESNGTIPAGVGSVTIVFEVTTTS